MGGRRAGLAALGLSLFAASLSAFLARRVFDGIPHVVDGVSYAFQARIFASGRLYLPPPPVPKAFAAENVILTATRWCSKYPPGFPLVLALGELAGTPWLVNPLLFGLAVLGAFRLGRALYDDATGLLGAALLAVSPFGLLMGAGTMAHPMTLAASLWSLSFLAEAATSRRTGPAVAAGALGGAAFLARPFSALALLLPAVLWALWSRRRDAIRAAGAMAAGFLPFLLVFLAVNAAVTGSPLRTPWGMYNPTEHFGGAGGESFPLTELFAKHLPWYLWDLDQAAWQWPWPAVVFLLPLPFASRPRGRDAVLLLSAASLLAGHAAYHYYDINHAGPRFAYEALGPLSLLVARGLLTLARFGSRALDSLKLGKLAPLGAAAAAVLLALPPLGFRLPFLARRLSHAYHGQSAEPLRRAAEAGVGPDALVLVSGNVTGPGDGEASFGYGSFFLHNSLDPVASRRVFARDFPELRSQLLAAYPRPEVWTVHVELERLPDDDPFLDDTWNLRTIDWRRLR
jgi:hypothetical protein